MATLAQIKASPAVLQAREWEKNGAKRCYLTLAGHSTRFAGCVNTKIFWDHVAGKLVIERGKGTTPRAFDASIETVKSI